MSDGFDTRELSAFARNFIDKTSREYPNKTKKFLRTEGNKLKKRVKAKAKSAFKSKTGNYQKGWKRGKPYKYNSDEDAIRVYNSKPHAHLLEHGHRIVTRSGKELGFAKGTPVAKEAEQEFQTEFIDDCEKFVDELLNEGLT